jgi:hypothetical protein
MSAVSEIESILSRREINNVIIKLLEGQNKQDDDRLTHLELISRSDRVQLLEKVDIAPRPISNRQMVGFKNIVTGKFISKGEQKTTLSNWSKSSDTIENNMFCIYNYKDNVDEYIISCDNLKVFDLSRTEKITYKNTYQKPFIFYKKHEEYNKILGDIGTNQRWNIIETENGIMIRSCYNKANQLVLIQMDDTYMCMPWNDIKDTELAKLAYWIIIN